MSEDTEQGCKTTVGRTRAPYEARSTAVSPQVLRHPWSAAGGSWYDEAQRLRLYYRTQRGPVARWRTNTLFEHEDLAYARARSRACRRVAKELDRLIAHGYVIWHDRTITGTDMVADHILVGPEGLTVIQTLPKSGASDGPYISPAAGVERQQAQFRSDAIVEQFEHYLPAGWRVLVYGVVCIDGNTPGVNTAPQVVSRNNVVNLARQRPRGLAPLQIADLALSIEHLFPAASSTFTR